MGKASRTKKDRRAHLDAPAVIHYHSQWRQGQAEMLAKFRQYLATVDAAPGGVVEFAPVHTWRQMRVLQLDLVRDLSQRPKLDPFDLATYKGDRIAGY